MESEDLARPVIVITSFLTKQVEYEIYTFGEQIVVMPLSEANGEWRVVSKGKTAMSEYAKHTISTKIEQLLPCDFLLKIKWASTLDLYVPETYKGRVIGKAGANVNQLEKDMRLKINLRSFDDLPFLDVKTKVNTPKKNARTDISFPAEYADQKICFLVGDEIAYFTADNRAVVSIKNKQFIKTIDKKWFVLVDTNKL